MFLILIFFPLYVSLLVLLFGRFFGRHGSAFLTISVLGCCCLIAWSNFFFYAKYEEITYINNFNWILTHNSYVGLDFLIDNVTLSMFVVVTTISFIVHWYSYDYMYNDPHLPRFMAYLSLFTFFMLILISAADLVVLFIGWEGVGLLSYLLINFWYTRIQANKSALKAIFANKIGDIAMLAAIALLYGLTGTTNIITIAGLAPYLLSDEFSFIFNISLYCLIIGAVGKSAQLFLHVWLPDAMEGPTPVSALLHAATMVTAGVFLVIRNSSLFELVPSSLFIILIIGAFTTFFAATTGVIQHDIKRIIAFSTCSQLGYMFVACGLSSYSTGLFHLFNHAFFKALLFLAAGSVIHALSDEQDIRRMGALANYLPLTFSFFFIASSSLMGIPFLSGFYSKDFIIELQAGSFIFGSSFFFLLITISAVLTAFYSSRLVFYVFLNQPNFSRKQKHLIHEPSWWVQGPLCFLAILSIVSGFLFEDLFIGLGSTFFSQSIFFLPTNWYSVQMEYIPYVYSYLPFWGTFFGVWLSWQTFTLRNYYYYYYYYYYCRMMFFSSKWGFDFLYNNLLIRFFYRLIFDFYYFIDKGIIEFFGPTGGFKIVSTFSNNVVPKIQTGSLTNYLQYIAGCVFGLILVVPFLFG